MASRDGFGGCTGEALIPLPAQLASRGAAAGGMGGTPSGADSSRLAHRRVGASSGGLGGRGRWAAQPWSQLCSPAPCASGEGVGRLDGPCGWGGGARPRAGAEGGCTTAFPARVPTGLEAQQSWVEAALYVLEVGAGHWLALGPLCRWCPGLVVTPAWAPWAGTAAVAGASVCLRGTHAEQGLGSGWEQEQAGPGAARGLGRASGCLHPGLRDPVRFPGCCPVTLCGGGCLLGKFSVVVQTPCLAKCK